MVVEKEKKTNYKTKKMQKYSYTLKGAICKFRKEGLRFD